MPNSAPAGPQGTLENTYPDGSNFVCADCGHEWPMAQAAGHSDKHTLSRQSASRNNQISTWQQKVHAATEKRLAAEI